MAQTYKIYACDIDGYKEFEIVSTSQDQLAESDGELVRNHIIETVNLNDIELEPNSTVKIGEVTVDQGDIISFELFV